jgi:FkbM family methyltransferase
MKSLRRLLLERLVARRPRHALLLSSAHLNVSGLQLRLAPESPLYRAGGGETVEFPLDEVLAPFVLDHGQWQTEELAFFEAHVAQQASVLVDVGANVGFITRQVMHRLPGVVAAVCFEPHPGNFTYLKRNLAHLPQCHPVQAALGRQNGELLFYEETNNAGNYSLNIDAMRGKDYRTSAVKCIAASEQAILAALSEAQRALPVIWKSDTQGYDEIIMTALPDSFWNRVQCGVMEITRIERPPFDQDRLGSILKGFEVLRFGDDVARNLAVDEVLEFAGGGDYRHRDLFFARS